MKRLSILLALLIALPAAAQIGYGTAKRVQYGSTLPTTCDPTTGDVYFINSGLNVGMYECQATNTWRRVLVVTDNTGLSIPGLFVVDGVNLTTISAAITAAGGTGAIFIPSSYTGLDAFPANPSNVVALDLRRGGGIAGGLNSISSSVFASVSDTCGIQEAYASIAASGGVITIPKGTCNFTPGIGVVICASNITLQGQGSTATLLKAKNADAIQFCNSVSGGLHENRVRDLGIGSQAGSVSGNGINIAETVSSFENSHNSFERIVISNMAGQGFHDGNCSWCSFRDIVLQGNSGRGMEIGTAAGGKGGSSNDSVFVNIEASTNAFGGMLVWGRNDTFYGGHWFANTASNDIQIRGSNNTFIGGWVEDTVFFPSVLIRRSDPVIYNNKFYGTHFTNTAGNGTGPVISVGQAGDAANSTVGTELHELVFTCNDAPSPLDCVGNNFADISIDTSATNTHLVGTSYHTAIGTALIDNGSNTASLCDDIANTCFSKLFGLTLSGGGGGLFAPLVTSRSANPASSGYLRLARPDQVCWRNNGNTADVCMTVNASDQLVAGGTTGILGGPFISNSSAAVPINGILRMAKTDTVKFRNNANSADITALSLDVSDIVQVGGTGGFKAGASGSAIADTRELLQSVHDCGSTTTCANTANGSNRTIMGTVTLVAGSAVIASITAFTSTASYRCQGTDKTAAAAVKIANTSTTSITITGTGTDVVDYSCTGN